MEVRAKKSLGQHFLTDLNIARKIAGAIFPEGGAPVDVLEIGGGMGVLTQFLLERPDIRLWGIEIDRESIAYMRHRFPAFAGSQHLIEGDFLKLDLGALWPQSIRIIGNFPYNISSQIFFKVLANRDLVPEVVGMVQREVALRIAEPPGSRTYGILSVLLQAWYDIEYLFTVPESVFSPPPKVKSAVIRLTRNSRSHLDCDEVLFVRVVKAAFNQRRKMLRNSLSAAFPELKPALSASPDTASPSSEAPASPLLTLRPEQLSVEQFVELTRLISIFIKPGISSLAHREI